ncbi:MAG: sugar ABC transporter ATP-binding protein [Chitinophagales bacterium]
MQEQVVLHMEHISKSFPGVQALDDVSLDVRSGEVLALVGENGAGKSTLIKILSGVHPRDAGQITLRGRRVDLDSPHQAQQLGISTIHQEFNLVPTLTVAENIFLGREPEARRGLIDRARLERESRQLLQELEVELDPRAKVRNLSVAQRQVVEIAKALSLRAELIIMDEPTSALTERETLTLFRMMQSLRSRGAAIIFISHRLEEVLAVSDRITILRDGRNVGTVVTAESSREAIVALMVGRTLTDEARPVAGRRLSRPLLEVKGLSTSILLREVSFTLHRGEILGFAGLMGAGRTEVARAIFGVDHPTAGEILLDGKPVAFRSPRDAIQHGLGFVPEDRKLQALLLRMTVRENISLAGLASLDRWGFVDRGQERTRVREYVDRLGIRTPSLEQRTANLSGGNQQKVVIAKWLFTHPRILILDEPTRGIDVGSKQEIHQLIRSLAEQGVSLIVISSELPEILALSDRVAVMHEGRLTGILERAEASPERIMSLATGQRLRRS